MKENRLVQIERTITDILPGRLIISIQDRGEDLFDQIPSPRKQDISDIKSYELAARVLEGLSLGLSLLFALGETSRGNATGVVVAVLGYMSGKVVGSLLLHQGLEKRMGKILAKKKPPTHSQ